MCPYNDPAPSRFVLQCRPQQRLEIGHNPRPAHFAYAAAPFNLLVHWSGSLHLAQFAV